MRWMHWLGLGSDYASTEVEWHTLSLNMNNYVLTFFTLKVEKMKKTKCTLAQ